MKPIDTIDFDKFSNEELIDLFKNYERYNYPSNIQLEIIETLRNRDYPKENVELLISTQQEIKKYSKEIIQSFIRSIIILAILVVIHKLLAVYLKQFIDPDDPMYNTLQWLAYGLYAFILLYRAYFIIKNLSQEG